MENLIRTDTFKIVIDIVKMFFIGIYTYITFVKIVNKNITKNAKQIFLLLFICLISVISIILKQYTNFLISTIFFIFMMSFICSSIIENNIGHSIMITIISLSINYIVFIIAIILDFILYKVFPITNKIIDLIIIIATYSILVYRMLKIKKFKNGINFFRENIKNEYLDFIILNISIIVLLLLTILTTTQLSITRSMFVIFIIVSGIMLTNIQKSLQLYYKQKLLVQELENTKKELATKNKEIEDLEAENIKISQNAHTLVHKQKSLAHKLDEMMLRTEISAEEAAEVRNRLEQIGKDLYKEKTAIELDKTEISEIDDMLKYMQSECSANKIEFELQLKGNIHHMTNNLISKADLETLLADHIKNAIIAINHTDNPNRSILVKLGKIDETYGLYIYDSGIEFKKETLENLGKKPSTTHRDEGGTGMGFMNTFDTLKKCNASLVIEEFGKPDKENYTKVIMFKFDNKNEFKVIHKK